MELHHRFLSPGWGLNKRVQAHLPLHLLVSGAIRANEVCLRFPAKTTRKLEMTKKERAWTFLMLKELLEMIRRQVGTFAKKKRMM